MFYQVKWLLVAWLCQTSEIESYKASRHKRAQDEKFHVLLSLYRMNPLKHSDIFQAFTNRMLLAGPAHQHVDAMNFNPKESTENQVSVKVKLKDIEKLNHVEPWKVKDIGQAEYSPGDDEAERFPPTHYKRRNKVPIVPDHPSLESNDHNLRNKVKEPDFDIIFEHIDSNETKTDVAKTLARNKTNDNFRKRKSHVRNSDTDLNVITLRKRRSKTPLEIEDRYNDIANFSEVIVFR